MELGSKRITAFIFARGGSKGIENKNLQLVGGLTLLERSVQVAFETGVVDRVIVSTDHEGIAEAARQAGAEVPFMRPDHLASDGASEWDAWQHAVSHSSVGEFDIFISVPATAPLRQAADLLACVRRYLQGDVDTVVTGTPSARSPYFNMVDVDAEGHCRLLADADQSVSRRQDARSSYDLTTVAYVSSPGHILKAKGVLDGRIGLVGIPRSRAIDVDHPLDLEIARMLCGRPELLEGEAESINGS